MKKIFFLLPIAILFFNQLSCQLKSYSVQKDTICLADSCIRPFQFFPNQKWGYINSDGIIVIPAMYDFASNFHNGLAFVELDKKKFYITTQNKNAFGKYFAYANDFNEGLAFVGQKKGKDLLFGVIDKTGKLILPYNYLAGSHFEEGIAVVTNKKGKAVYIDTTGKVLFHHKPDYLLSNYSKESGLFLLEKSMGRFKSSKYGYINLEGKEIIKPQFEYAHGFKFGLAPVRKDSLYGFIDNKGKQRIPFIYNSVDRFYEGLAMVKKGSLYGYIDSSGQYKIQPIYTYATHFSEGLAFVMIGDKRSFIDHEGKDIILIPSDWDYIENEFRRGTTGVYINKKNCLINKQGKVVFIFL
ncbi:WG repeat-containing protein [Ferruginibacter sp. SUN002]|uniref:WG repeat-containing protein n=1 Tax=Ferruginibacter sp. SUN002 TaxID=2937789 RepID=UPI003D35E365